MYAKNEWDKLKKVIVGVADYATIPPMDKSLRTISEHIDEITKNLKLEFITPESTYIGIKEIKFKIDGQEVVVS